MRKKYCMYCCRMKLSNIHLAEFKLSILYYIHQHVNSRCCQMSDHSECGAIWGGCFGTLVLLVALFPLNSKSALGCSSGHSTCSQHISFKFKQTKSKPWTRRVRLYLISSTMKSATKPMNHQQNQVHQIN